ncbi:Leucine-rich repeat-containing G-protein coupled receptor 4 [Microtus ochrogaster]|uniref:Leucine-rich repeat-containing G-protein coupled receptor 4 n=1 Tax=Microtus ochrogaster TaxID=79684 RepID=A0A8J6GMM2_MICOH|nr:Leucine-rich repeat-containing G-protein coupled receptor 4 [Microtus ochrogaster]
MEGTLKGRRKKAKDEAAVEGVRDEQSRQLFPNGPDLDLPALTAYTLLPTPENTSAALTSRSEGSCHGLPEQLLTPKECLKTPVKDISMNNITQLPEDAFKNFPFLEELQLAGNDLSFIHPKALSGLKELKVLLFLSYDTLGMVQTGAADAANVTSTAENEEHSQIIIHCTPSTGAFKPCEYLLGSWMIRLTVWFIFLVALLFNTLVIVTVFASCSSLPASTLFIGLISVSNLLMGIYTGILTFLDAVSWGRFAEFGIWWETGSGCKVAGSLAVFSSESAVFLLTLAAVERSLSAKEIMKNGKSRFTVTLVLLNSLAFLLMAIIYTKLYCNLEKEDLSENSQSSMIKHVAWLIFTNCIFFCPVAFFSFAPLITAISISPEIMKSVTLIFFPLPACLNPVLYVFFNPKFKEDWKLLKRRVTRKHGSVSVSISSQGGCGEQDFYYDCGMYSHLQGNLTVCDCCESFLLTKPVSCKHLIKSHSCPVLTVASCQRPEGYWSDCGTQSAHSDYADEEDSFVSDSSDQVQACGRACFYQSRGFPLVRYAYNLPRVRD